MRRKSFTILSASLGGRGVGSEASTALSRGGRTVSATVAIRTSASKREILSPLGDTRSLVEKLWNGRLRQQRTTTAAPNAVRTSGEFSMYFSRKHAEKSTPSQTDGHDIMNDTSVFGGGALGSASRVQTSSERERKDDEVGRGGARSKLEVGWISVEINQITLSGRTCPKPGSASSVTGRLVERLPRACSCLSVLAPTAVLAPLLRADSR